MGATVALLAARTWILLGHPLPLGALGDPQVLLANKLQGWFHQGTVLGQWSWPAWVAGLLWEWLPAALCGAGTWQMLRGWNPAAPFGRIMGLRGPWLPATLLTVISAAISLAAFEGIPHVQDSIAQQFQAEVFSAGRLWAPVPPEGWLLRSEYMVQHEGRWFAQYPPGHAALLALGTLLGVPWLVGPLLAGASALLLHSVGKCLYGRRVASLAVWLLCLSPFVWFMSGERMNHVSTLFWVLVALRLVAPALSRRPRLPTLAVVCGAGAALGFAISTRPLCGAAWVLVVMGGSATIPGRRLSGIAVCALGIGLGVLPLLAFNAGTTGSAWVSGYELQWGSTGWGFGTAQWGSPHSPALGLAAAWSNWDALGKYLWEWPIPGTLLLAGCILLPRWRRTDRLLLAALACVIAAYVPYFFQDLCLGPRFLYAALPAIVLLGARGAHAFAAWAGKTHGKRRREAVRAIPAWLAVLTGVGLSTNVPVLWQWYSRDFWGTSTRLVREVERRDLRHAVVFIRDRGRLRCEELRRRGISLSIAQAAVDALDPEWLDARMAALDRSGGRPEQLGAELKSTLSDPRRAHQRQSPPWIEAAGVSANINLGLWANGPRPETRKVIYALHPGGRIAEVLPAFAGRSLWAYDWDAQAQQFRLTELYPSSGMATRGP